METLKAALIERDIVLAEGADARSYLQTQLTQDVESLAVGRSAWSFLLQPKSHIVALVRVTAVTDDRIALDTEPGWGDAVRERIDGFLFRTDVSFSSHRWPGVAYRGPGADAIVTDAPIDAPVRWGAIEGRDVIGPGVTPPDDVPIAEPKSFESLRIWAGWPRMGTDIDADTTPAMTGLVDRTVSFTKGCYTGQEFVARTHYRHAAPPRRLVHVRFHPCAKVSPGDPLVLDGEPVGTLTSIADCQPFALAYLARAVEVPAEVTLGGCPASVEAIPSREPEVAAPRGTAP